MMRIHKRSHFVTWISYGKHRIRPITTERHHKTLLLHHLFCGGNRAYERKDVALNESIE